MGIRQIVLRNKLNVFLYQQFIQGSKDQFVSVYKQRIDLNTPCNEWGGCWSGLDDSITYKDIEGLLEDES